MFRDKNHKSILMRPLERLFGIPSPYNFFEGLGCLYRENFGPSHRGVRVPCLPKNGVLNEDVIEEMTIGFVGDILDTKGLPAEISEEITHFFSDCDVLIGNFESTITDLPGHSTSVRHIPQIIDALEGIFPPQSTFLSIANNHAGDYPAEVMFESIHKLEKRGFNVFGWIERPFVDVGNSVRVVAATDWSNASCDSVYMLDDKKTPLLKRADAYNILFPHWGYEHELYPRRSIMRRSQAWVDRGFDVIIAHHGHTPRAIYAVDVKESSLRTLVADSLGDFICGFTQEWFHHGVVIKIGIGRDSTGRRAVGRLYWEFCETRPGNGVVNTTLRNDLPDLFLSATTSGSGSPSTQISSG